MSLREEIFMQVKPDIESFARIKVVGVGGSGCSIISRMIARKVSGVEFIGVNTDAQALHQCKSPTKVHIGKETTKGLGAGSNSELGKKAAEENSEDIQKAILGADMVFVTCGHGGGTGTGASPLIAAIAKESGALTVGIFTKPFSFEGKRRKRIAEQGIEDVKDKVDTLIVIPNDRILQVIDKKTSLLDAFGVVDDILYQGISGISDLITVPGMINVDFADVKSIMEGTGSALMGIGKGSGENRAVEAAKAAIDSPLLELSIDGAKGVLFNIVGGNDLGMHEVDEAAKVITDSVDPEANIIFGAVIDESLQGEIKITVVATGFEKEKKKAISEPRPQVIGISEEEGEEEELEVPAFIRRKMK
jgi:cell division protein FtsZ